MFLQDVWYTVAWNYPIKHAPFARTICGERGACTPRQTEPLYSCPCEA